MNPQALLHTPCFLTTTFRPHLLFLHIVLTATTFLTISADFLQWRFALPLLHSRRTMHLSIPRGARRVQNRLNVPSLRRIGTKRQGSRGRRRRRIISRLIV